MSSSKKNKQNFEELKWKALVVGEESPRRFMRSMETSRGWESDESSRFPMDIVLAFPRPVNIWKFVIGCSDNCLPTKVEVRVGMPNQKESKAESDEDEEDNEPKYEDAKNAKYHKRSTITFEKRHKHEKTFESKTLFMDVIGQFVWIVIYEPYDGNSIHLKELSIYGYKNIYPSPEEEKERKKREKELEKEAEKIKNEKQSRGSSAGSRSTSSRMSSRSGLNDKDDDYKSQTMPYSSEGDGVSKTEGAASEPLTSVRTIKQVLKEKGKKALKDDKIVEATTCRRAVERLDEYEERLVEMKKKMSQAMEAKDYDYAERYRLAMQDSRDTVFRAIHLDLLLKQEDLRALGMNSKWADPAGDS